MANPSDVHNAAAQSRPLVFGFGDDAASQDTASDERKGVPVTILAGFLGSGKTTLLNRILTTNHGKRIAVIQNEFGEDLGLGSTLAAEGRGAEIFEECYEMNNGCICCSVRDQLVNTLERIMKNRSRFDYVLVETTGMANPGPIASIFWLDEELESDLFLDAIITVVDAKHVGLHLANESGTSEEAAMQIAFADRILLNKIDLVTDNELSEVKDRVRSINPLAPIYCTQNSEVNLDDILGIKAFDATRAMALDSALPTAPQPGPFTSTSTTSPSSRHKAEVGTVAITEERALDLTKFNAWLGAILWESEFADRIFRIKGLLSVKGEDRMVVLQGVHTLFEAEPSAPWPPDRPRQSKVVLIGRRLDRDVLAQGLARCVAD